MAVTVIRPAGNLDVLKTDIAAILARETPDVRVALVALANLRDPWSDVDACNAVIEAATHGAALAKAMLEFIERHDLDRDGSEEMSPFVDTDFQNDALAIAEALADEMMPAVGEAVARIAELAASRNPCGRPARRRRRHLNDAVDTIDETRTALGAFLSKYQLGGAR